ncbi:putative mannose-6-phosphate isomerase GmuF [Anaerohalosphaera lusitana]|uniref:Putative mannose-6-phosphate isomerase GmuF n=1 Tax=Anaerohalosphaera lusitana TaxID=1936003 RepID=A0A1U9NNQ5_9BACT|nr:type I phosphomannose isomerase catalytic subunit [Anaerohalosphaera lusitana]AQT69358.1 putative mannose-6-phosphate isomerase GmuF [Anaerohalosphaera lusitana]
MKTYPLKFKPIFKERIWGGRKLKEAFGKELPEGAKIGESWELADLPEDKSVIVNGELAGKTLAEAIEMMGEAIVGSSSYEPPFPLLIKLLDAQDKLSVQVHPDAQTCKRRGKGDPKTECWYIIDKEPGAVIYKGLKEGVTKEQFAEAIEDGTVAELLVEVPVEVGECHFLPAGTAHAIGAGLLIAEIQTPSDTTYRVFDWNRVDDSGKGRELHVEDAMESITFDQDKSALTVNNVGRLVDSESFKVDKGHQAKGCEMILQSGPLKVLMMLSGTGEIRFGEDSQLPVEAGDTVLLPAAFEGVMIFGEESEYLVATV